MFTNYVQYQIRYGGRFDTFPIFVHKDVLFIKGEHEAVVHCVWELLNGVQQDCAMRDNPSARILRRMGRRWDKGSLRKFFSERLSYTRVQEENRHVSSS